MKSKVCQAKDPSHCPHHGWSHSEQSTIASGDISSALQLRSEAANKPRTHNEVVAASEPLKQPSNQIWLAPVELTDPKQLVDAYKNFDPSKHYRAEFEIGTTWRGKYRRILKKNNIFFNEQKDKNSSTYTVIVSSKKELGTLIQLVSNSIQTKMDLEAEAKALTSRG